MKAPCTESVRTRTLGPQYSPARTPPIATETCWHCSPVIHNSLISENKIRAFHNVELRGLNFRRKTLMMSSETCRCSFFSVGRFHTELRGLTPLPARWTSAKFNVHKRGKS